MLKENNVDDNCAALLRMEGRQFNCMRRKAHIGVHRHTGLTEGVTMDTKVFTIEWSSDAPLPKYMFRGDD